MAKALKNRNPMAAVLSHGNHQPKTVRARKGKGSFSRKAKHRGRAFD